MFSALQALASGHGSLTESALVAGVLVLLVGAGLLLWSSVRVSQELRRSRRSRRREAE